MPAIDMGTGLTKAAYCDTSGKPIAVPNARGELSTPSMVYLSPAGEPTVGTEAIEQGALDPSRCIRNPKTMLGSTESLIKGDKPFTATDAVASILAQRKEDLERSMGVVVEEVVATHPANWMDDQKQALMEAYERVGLKVLRLVPEPTAGGIAYACEKSGNGMRLAVYDLGAGTFDTSILLVEGAEIRVLATHGVPRLGGNDFDRCLWQRAIEAFNDKFGKEPDPQQDAQLLLELDQKIERAKVSLNTSKQVPLVIGYKGDQLVVQLTQQQFHADIQPLIRQSLDAFDEAVKAAGLDCSKLDRLIMVGGGSLMPCVQNAVADHTGLVPRADIDPTKAVVYGGALAYLAEMARQNRTPRLRGHAIPHPGIFVREVTAYPVGCCVVDGPGANKTLRNSVLIQANTPIPCQRTERFVLEFDDQTDARIEVLQGEADEIRDRCLIIGELTLTNLPKEAKRTPRIEVEYTIDSNGMCTATATDIISSQRQTTSVDYKKGVKPRQRPALV